MNSSNSFRFLRHLTPLVLAFAFTLKSPASTTTFSGDVYFMNGAYISTMSANVGGTEFALYLSSGVSIASGSVRFQDGSRQYTSAENAASTTTVIPAQTFTAASFGDCFAGSTVTLSFRGESHVRIWFSGAISMSTAAVFSLAVLQDGMPLTGYDGAAVAQHDTDVLTNATFSLTPATVTAQGVHTFCLQPKISTGTGNLINDGGTARALFGAFLIQ